MRVNFIERERAFQIAVTWPDRRLVSAEAAEDLMRVCPALTTRAEALEVLRRARTARTTSTQYQPRRGQQQ